MIGKYRKCIVKYGDGTGQTYTGKFHSLCEVIELAFNPISRKNDIPYKEQKMLIEHESGRLNKIDIENVTFLNA